MKIEKEIGDDHQATLKVEFSQDVLESYRRSAARKIAGRGKIPGFRPGKAPYEIILRNYGEAAINEEAVDLLVEKEYQAILKEAEINPGASGTLESVDGLEPPRLTFRVPLAPEIDLGRYHEIRLPYEWMAPAEKDVERALDDLRRMYATTETVEREAQTGDHVLLDVKSDEAGLTRSGYATLIHAEPRETEWPFAGFSANLVGMKAGDIKRINHTFAADHEVAELQGKAVELDVTVKTVRSLTLPEVDDDFAKSTGLGETVAALREAVAKQVEARSKAAYDDEYFVKLIEAVKQQATIKYAPQALEHETHHVLEDLGRRLAQQGMDLPTYYKVRNTDAERFLEEEAKPVARKRLERALILEELIRREHIEIDREELDAEFNSTVNDLSVQGVDFGRIRGGRQGQQRVAEALATESASRLMTRRALDVLKDIATGVYKPKPEPTAETAESAEKPADEHGDEHA